MLTDRNRLQNDLDKDRCSVDVGSRAVIFPVEQERKASWSSDDICSPFLVVADTS